MNDIRTIPHRRNRWLHPLLFLMRNLLLVFFFMTTTPVFSAPEKIVADVCVYGGVSGGVTAAIQAARMGKTTVLVSPTPHLGGMTTSGLGFTDFGNEHALGGISREFYHRIYLHYRQDAAWTWEKQGDFKNIGQGAAAFIAEKELATVFEPSIAEKILNEMLREAGVRADD